MKPTLTRWRRLSLLAQSSTRATSHPPDSPEARILAELTAFCESGGPNNTGDEYLHLPAIVEAAESSPGAAKEAADLIRRVLSNPSSKKGYKQYNAIMLVRILVDNPGATFTRNFDAKFVSIVKDLLRNGRDMSVQQILRETLEFLTIQKASDPNLAPLAEMWKKEKLKFEKAMGVSSGPWVQPHNPGQRDGYFPRPHRPRGLPPLEELTSRIAEANTSAGLLLQLVQSTPTAEFYSNDLLKEFSARCQAAARSIQGYMNATNPSPDEDTMLTLIETNDRLSVALSKYQRAAVIAKRNVSRTDSQTGLPPSSQQWAEQHFQQPPHQPEQAQNIPAPLEKRSVPLLSIPRKAMNKLRSDKQQQQPQDAHSQPESHPRHSSTQYQPPPHHQYQYSSHQQYHPPVPRTSSPEHATTTTTPPSNSAVSPLATTPPLLPLTSNPNTFTATTNPARTAALTSNGPQNNNSSYQYDSGEFQVENPFADTYSTSRLDDRNDHSNNNINNSNYTSTTSGMRGTGNTGNADADADNEPVTSSTYYPDARNAMVDGNMPGAAGADAMGATERFYGAARR
ncbi:hypothetical protein ACJ72_04168 [Emergomyces africanus]|uniref:GAT domain-containing protein n=1 Tax=Emergomyces africanus TaxID=1955775 RepID=A0A1B7NXJ7_9EURO|nr:hypothetical protein ACJ72_04168 [Emergomyces africanus]